MRKNKYACAKEDANAQGQIRAREGVSTIEQTAKREEC